MGVDVAAWPQVLDDERYGIHNGLMSSSDTSSGGESGTAGKSASDPTGKSDGLTQAKTPASADSNQSYELGIDEQVEKFTELRQKLTYFLITASIAVIAFSMNFYANTVLPDKLLNNRANIAVLVAGAVTALGATGLALINLHLGHLSFARHLGYRYQRRGWTDLSDKEQRSWDRITWSASTALTLAYMALFAETLLIVIFFLSIFS